MIKLINGSKNSIALQDKISIKLMEFVCHGQKSYSKRLTKFIQTGMHDLRAGSAALDILRIIEEHMENIE